MVDKLTSVRRNRVGGCIGALSARPALVAAILTVLVFLPGLAGDFVFDDRVLIVGNPHAHALRELPRVLTTHLWDLGEPDAPPPAYRYYRPFVSATYLLDWVISGGKPWFFHATNLMAHALAVFLAVRIAARWLGSESLGLVAGLAFALHPPPGPRTCSGSLGEPMCG